jgi:hypothetical protein
MEPLGWIRWDGSSGWILSDGMDQMGGILSDGSDGTARASSADPASVAQSKAAMDLTLDTVFWRALKSPCWAPLWMNG